MRYEYEATILAPQVVRRSISQWWRLAAALAVLFTSCTRYVIFGQITTGILEGTVRDVSGRPQSEVIVTAVGSVSTSWSTKSSTAGHFELILPPDEYEIRTYLAGPAIETHVLAGQVTCISLLTKATPVPAQVQSSASTQNVNEGISCRAGDSRAAAPGFWYATPPRSRDLPGPYSLGGILLLQNPTTVAEPLDFTGAQNTRISLISQRTFSWTAAAFSLEGMNATDPYQPGSPVVFPDVSSLDEVIVEKGMGSGVPANFGVETGLFLKTPGRGWHGTLGSSGTGAALASSNLPDPASRGILQQSQQYRWFTRDYLGFGGPLGRRADMYFSGTGQWASEMVPTAQPGRNQNSTLLFGNFGVRYGVTRKDQIDFVLSGSRINLSNRGEPAGLEALTRWRMMPAYESPYGFNGLAEVDHLDFIQGGWIRQLPESFRSGVLQVRYSASIAHLDTKPVNGITGQSVTELLGATVTGAPPLANMAVRQRQSIRAVLEPEGIRFGRTDNHVMVGGDWDRSNVLNRFTAPTNMELITAGGQPAYAVELSSPVHSRDRVQSFSSFVRDQIRPTHWLSIDAGVVGEFSRGSLPAQRSPAGTFVPARDFPAHSDLIVWNTASPHVGFIFNVPRSERFLVGGTYTRVYAPLAGHYLDFANPNSLSGLVFGWNGVNGVFQPGEIGPLLRRFGGAYASISPSLHPPYADQFDLYGAASMNSHVTARIQLFRRDDKQRIIVMNTGVPARAYKPVEILDSGPDGIPGTFDDRFLTVYAQNRSTLGADTFLLENQPDLRMLFEGFTAELSARYAQLNFHASFTAEKSFGPTNPGNGVLENDPGIVGALYQDPNTLINASGHDYFDRSFLGKVQMTYQLPRRAGGIELLNVADYLDGLPFARELLVTGFTQGPFVVPATIRGSPEGGNRAEYALNWNLCLARTFAIRGGRVRFSMDVLNVTNSGNRIQENDVSGLNFNMRLPVLIQAPRSIRFGVQYAF
jgi:hypothetical protein